ncbi:MAG: hypothetical protein HRF49_03960 [bacterium]
MSSTRKQPPAKGKPEAPIKQPIFTPQNMVILFGVLAVVFFLVFFKGFYQTKVKEIATLDDEITKQQELNATYQRKAAKLAEAEYIKEVMDEKLESVQFKFFKNQDDILEFFKTVLFDLLVRSNIDPYTIELDFDYEFVMPWYIDDPIETMPDWIDPDKVAELFSWKYISKPEGQDPSKKPEGGDAIGVPDTFIKPLPITIKKIRTTYEGMKRLIENMQRGKGYLYTVHCFKNDSGENSGLLRVFTDFEMEITIYLMNPNQNATGDTPEGMPGAETC